MAHKIIIENKADRIIAEQKIYEIAEILKHHSFPHSEFGFLGGNSGIIMFLYYFSRFSHDNSYSQIATSRIMQLIEKVQEEENLDWSIGSGLAGVCYTFQHLQKYEFITANSSDILGDLDNYFHQVMLLRMKNGNYDFFDGALGIGLYLLSREYFTKQKDYLLDLVGLIYNERKKVNSKNTTWLTAIDKKADKEIYGSDFGIPHGIAGIILMLTKLFDNNINRKKLRLLLNPTINFLLIHKNEAGLGSIFPNKVDVSGKSINPSTSRIGWCYGDLGISVALWHASKFLERKDWELEAINLLQHSSNRLDLSQNGIVDAGLCHGTAGIAHIFNRMYSFTEQSFLKETALYWYDQTIKMAHFKDGLAGYKAWQGPSRGMVNEYGFLEGIAGIGLTLISAISDIDPAWDECLLLS